MSTETLEKYAAEIKKDWDPAYTAIVKDDILVVNYKGKTAATCDLKGKVSGEDADAVDQLTYMTNR